MGHAIRKHLLNINTDTMGKGISHLEVSAPGCFDLHVLPRCHSSQSKEVLMKLTGLNRLWM